MKISVIVPHVPVNKVLDDMLDRCIASLRGYDELIVVINDGIGYGAAFNRGFKYAKGNFIIAASNDTIVNDAKNLRILCDFSAVTYSSNSQWGCFFCLPRWVYEKVGGFDESFGLAYWEDVDYLKRLDKAGILRKRVHGFSVEHVGGVTVKALGREQEASEIGKQRFLEKYGELDYNIS